MESQRWYADKDLGGQLDTREPQSENTNDHRKQFGVHG